jgi:hypothetical protein
VLEGICDSFAYDVRAALGTCTNGERLAVCLLFMSELPTQDHHLGSIEGNLRKIFAPSSHGNTPDDYKDFQATTVRSVFNLETALNPHNRLWVNVGRGYWRNTTLGNKYALQTLFRKGVTI